MQTELIRYDTAKRALAELISVDEVKLIRDRAIAIQEYARRAQDRQMELDACKYRLRCERRAGELLAETVRPVKPSLVSTADDTKIPAGISRDQSSQWQQLAAIPEDIFDKKVESLASPLSAKAILNHQKVPQTSGDYNWYTPEKYIELSREVMGSIDLDPASCNEANKIVKADKFYTKDEDGLLQPWYGNVFCNPPYNFPNVEMFSEKMVDSYKSGKIKQGILLTHSSTDTRWWHIAFMSSSAICFTLGRINFLNANASEKISPLKGQTFMYFGENTDRFSESFKTIGSIGIFYER